VPKTRRRSDHQEQKRKCVGDELPIKKPPLKKPRQDRLSAQARREEKKKTKKEDADMLVYISEQFAWLVHRAATMNDKTMFLPGGLTRMDQIVAPAKECFMMFVCMSLRATCIVQSVSKRMWC
jgi:hypothetical protein